ncbi:hypothetical protein G5714_004073 [Onychostoma macrolepis]|uniref:Uncharacterized protein n=1 Tax=Onychostoma macrolepis TaxID=369639 RepID=A0A7J6DCI3_9TELE|nr:hypothetical protein G5714_004073 [Onychostoma macrolepis]
MFGLDSIGQQVVESLSGQMGAAPHSDSGNLDNRTVSCVLMFTVESDWKRQIVRVEMKSSQNLNDPVVMNRILGKIEQVLKEKGLSQYAKLSWRTQSNGNVFQKNYQKRDAPKHSCVSKLRK